MSCKLKDPHHHGPSIIVVDSVAISRCLRLAMLKPLPTAQLNVHAQVVITHIMPLEQAQRAYTLFNEKKDNCIKVTAWLASCSAMTGECPGKACNTLQIYMSNECGCMHPCRFPIKHAIINITFPPRLTQMDCNFQLTAQCGPCLRPCRWC